MATLTVEALNDLVELTFNTMLARRQWTDLSLDKQFYTLPGRLLGRKLPVKSGPKLIWKFQKDNTQSARFTGPFSPDQYDVRNLSGGGEQPWSIVTANYVYDVYEEEFQGTDMEQLVDVILMREHAMYNSWWELMEEAMWTGPTSSTQDPRPIYGIPHWYQKNATEGFTGGDPSGFASGAGNIAVANVPRWKNFSGEYVSFTRDSVIKLLRKALSHTRFRTPHRFPNQSGGEPQWSLYTVYDVIEQLHEFLETRNDNIRDIAGMYDGLVKGIPLQWVPALDESGSSALDTSNPIYGVNWNITKIYFQRGRDMVRSKPSKKAGYHTVHEVHIDSTCAVVSTDRRSGGFVISQAS